VTVTAERDGDGCLVTVADTGVGIEPEALDHIFDRFYRTDASRSRDAGGTGLGLSLVKRIVELHGGHIRVDSVPGRGTVVQIHLPKARTHLAADSPATSQ